MRYGLVIVAVCILALIAGATSVHAANLSAAALKELIPEGYKVEKTLACDDGQGTQHEYLVALSDGRYDPASSFPEKPVMILLVAAGKKAVLEDSATLHHGGHAGV